MNRGPVAEIDLPALGHNLKIIRKLSNERPVIAVVKADAYGHGSVEISKKLLAEGVTCLGVAFTGEAAILRDAGITSRIIVFFDRSSVADYFDLDLVPVIQDVGTARRFSEEASKRNAEISVHLKIDTGMGRTGFRSEGGLEDLIAVSAMKGIRVEGLMSHFSEADLSDRSYALRQIDIFSRLKDGLSKSLGRKVISHMANSAAVLSQPEGHFDAVRTGLILYGCSPFKEVYGLLQLMRIKTRVLAIRRLPAGSPVGYGRTFVTKRDSLIAVVPVGYADGYSRLFSNNSEMLVAGKRVPVAGRVCMDLTMLDVTDVGGAGEGDEVVIMGRQGSGHITADELASRINTISYEMLTSLGSRARKEYLH